MSQSHIASSRLPFQKPEEPDGILRRTEEQPEDSGQPDPQNKDSHSANDSEKNETCTEYGSVCYSSEEFDGGEARPRTTSNLSVQSPSETRR